MTNHQLPARLLAPFMTGMGALWLASGWLVETKSPPWVSIYNEVWSAIAFAAVLALLLSSSWRQRLRMSGLSLFLLLCTGLPLLQWSAGVIAWHGDAVAYTLYLAGLWLAVTLTQNLSAQARRQLLNALALGFVLGASASVLIQFLQLTGLPIDWVRRVDPTRPSANIAQPNLLGTLLILGLLAAYYLYRQTWISRGFLYLISLLLTFGMALTGSRAAIVGLLVVTLLHVYATRRGRLSGDRWHFPLLLFMLAVGYVGVWLLRMYVPLGDMAPGGSNPALIRMGSSLRIDAWIMFIHRALEAPWLGYGMGQSGVAHLIGESHLQPFGAHFQSAHNLVLEVLLWFGLPVGGGMLLLGGYWVWRATTRLNTDRQWLASGAMAVLLSHSMLEFPLYYAYFLLPFGILLGLNSPAPRRPNWTLNAAWLYVPLVVASLTAVQMVRDHEQLGRLMLRWGLAQMTGQRLDLAGADVGLFNHWQHLLRYGHTDLETPVHSVDIDTLEKTAHRFPTIHVILNYSVQLHRLGRPADAQRWLQRACAIHSLRHCESLKQRWEALPEIIPGQANPPWPNTVFDRLPSS